MKKAMATITDVCDEIEGITAHAQYLANAFVLGQMVWWLSKNIRIIGLKENNASHYNSL